MHHEELNMRRPPIVGTTCLCFTKQIDVRLTRNMGSYCYLVLFLFSCTNCFTSCTSYKNSLEKHIPLYTIASQASVLNSTISTCKLELKILQDAIDNQLLWSLKVLDSSGQPQPGKLQGNRFWTGSYSECLDTMNKAPLILSRTLKQNNGIVSEYPPFTVNYFVAHIKYNDRFHNPITVFNEDVITLGLCLPSSCSTKDVSFILEKIFRDKVLFIGNFYSMNFSIIEVKTLSEKWLFTDVTHYIIIGAITFTFLMMVIGTIYDIFVRRKYLDTNSNINDATVNKTMPKDKIKTELSVYQASTIGKILICFSVYTNTKKIFFSYLQDEVSSIHGLRFLSMVHLLLLHSVFFMFVYVDSMKPLIRFSEGFFNQIIANAQIVNDTFFVQSGFLLAYLHVKRTNDIANKPCNYKAMLKQLCLSVIMRFIRLTPAYIMVLGIVHLNWTWFDKNTQFYMYERPETCRKYWWTNILYINNLYKSNEMCMIWSWHMACDMQFFIICKALLILSSAYRRTAVSILGILFVGSIALSGYISYIYEHIPTVYEIALHAHVVYYAPWIRISPYIVGVITGYVLAKKNTQVNLKKKTVILCWCLVGACNISILFALYHRNISILFTVFYTALSRPLWAIGVAWIIAACLTQYGGIANHILSFKGWIPGSRLSYCAYLVNPLLIYSFYQNSETIVRLDILIIILQGIGIIVNTYVFSFVISLMAEIPYNSLQQIFLKPRSMVAPSSSTIKKRS